MSQQVIEQNADFTIYKRIVGSKHAFMTVSVKNPEAILSQTVKSIYQKIAQIIKEDDLHIVLERQFGQVEDYEEIQRVRNTVLQTEAIDHTLPITFIQGLPEGGSGLAGIQLRAVKLDGLGDKVWTIYDDGIACGRGWHYDSTSYIILQDIHGNDPAGADNSREAQTERMFEKANRLLKEQDAEYRDVARTWIYLDDILEWYDAFNVVRTGLYKSYGLIRDDSQQSPEVDQLYLPASTGILGRNPYGASGVMDVLAIVRKEGSELEIEPNTGTKQKSAFRYGSAFARAMNLREPGCTQILVSGTASIDDEGHSVHLNDTREQIKKTFQVVAALIGKEGATLKDICKATAFVKCKADVPIYHEVMIELGLENMPVVCVVADVCRDELLFELDAVAVVESK